MATHLQQWIDPQQITFQCDSQNTQFIQKQLKHKMACTKNWANIVLVPHSTQCEVQQSRTHKSPY